MRAEYARPVVKPPAYEYHGLMAEAWDLLRGDTSGWEDRPFYLELIRRFGEPALDVGCGTGRLLLDYLAEGIEIDGLDVSPDMLALSAGRRPRRSDWSPRCTNRLSRTCSCHAGTGRSSSPRRRSNS